MEFLPALLGALVALAVALLLQTWRLRRLKSALKAAVSERASQAATYGRISEQWAPFLADYPFDPQGFRFLGSPVDGVQFEEDRVVFVEMKTHTSTLSSKQRRIRDLVRAGKVEWFEFRMESRTEAPKFFSRR